MKHSLTCVALILSFILIGGCGSTQSTPGNHAETDNESASQTVEELEPVKPEPIKLGTPDLSWFIDGEKALVYWDQIPNASSYTVTYNDEVYSGFVDSFVTCNAPEGFTALISVTAESDSENYTTGDAATLEISNPSITDYRSVPYYAVAFYSFRQAEAWANANGYDYTTEITEDGSMTILRVVVKDEENSGIKSRVARGIVGMIDGAVGGASEAKENITPGSVFSDAIENYVEYGNVKDAFRGTIDDIKKEAEATIKRNAFKSTLSYVLQDTDMHFDYYFLSDILDCSCDFATFSQEVAHHETVRKDLKENWDAESDYVFSAPLSERNMKLFINLGQDCTNEQYPRWVIEARTYPIFSR